MEAPRFPERQSLPGSVERNTDPIVEAVLPKLGELEGKIRVLELASGKGHHVAALAAHAPHATFQPTEADEWLCGRIAERTEDLPNVLKPVVLDLTDSHNWDRLRETNNHIDGPCFNAVLAFNLLHIAESEVTLSIFEQASRTRHPELLSKDGFIAFYGAFKEYEDEPLSEGNLKFDRDLRARNPAFGIRSIEVVSRVAKEHGYELAERIGMPAKNWILVYRSQHQT
ncbi:hypothetical protein OC846_004768 [Tilletia horrida]|uniref:Methyltransferase domain-containing protein n=1 Tax=Tilletia horrida TaxID=155126 RepID=A0AAN6GP63_9BASI|nr:hypothetical protein OC846_004768 [Tilletia horrida]